jgi:hypothetical protein
MNQLERNTVESAYKALLVVALSKNIQNFLSARDPKANEQVNNALDNLEHAFDFLKVPERRLEKKPDFTYQDHGSVILLFPKSESAWGWVEDHLPHDTGWHGMGAGIERRYAHDILQGIDNDGLTFRRV